MQNKGQDIIYSSKSKDKDFEERAIEVYEYQRKACSTYRKFLCLIGKNRPVNHIEDIPFLPISLFKQRIIKSGVWKNECVFHSSGTGGIVSRHYIRSLDAYHNNAKLIFESVYGDISSYCLLACLPNYHHNKASSLLSMVDYFMRVSDHPNNGYYLNNFSDLFGRLEENNARNWPTILFGVSFALLDYAEKFTHPALPATTILETGGMKRYMRSLTKRDIMDRLSRCFSGARIHGEYGMTECLSQMYSVEQGLYLPNRMMRAYIGDPTDPLTKLGAGKTGQIQLIDLANVHTVSFIRTDDLGIIDDRGRLSVLGRLTSSDLRGCNYLI